MILMTYEKKYQIVIRNKKEFPIRKRKWKRREAGLEVWMAVTLNVLVS